MREKERNKESERGREGGRELVHDSVLFLAHSLMYMLPKRETSITEPSFAMGLQVNIYGV